MQYRSYIADALQAIAGNVARAAGGHVLPTRYIDIARPHKEEEMPEEKKEEFAVDFIHRAGLVVQ